jgi:hypothetical protein
MPSKPKLIKLKNTANDSLGMTCIIGGKCKDGVVLIADRKIIDKETERVSYAEKISSNYNPIVFASSGSTIQYGNFKRNALHALQPLTNSPHNYQDTKISPRVSGAVNTYSLNFNSQGILEPDNSVKLFSYINKLQTTVKELRRNNNRDFDVLFCTQTQDRGAVIHYLHHDGTPEDIYDFKIIGDGEKIALMFVSPLYHPNISMNDFAIIGYFTIKYIDKFELHNGIGLGGQKPQVWFIPNHGNLYRDKDCPQLIESFELKTNKMINNFLEYGLNKLLDKL